MAHALYWLGSKALDRMQQAFVRNWNGDTVATADLLMLPHDVAKDWAGSDWFADALAAHAKGWPEEQVVKDQIALLRTEPADRDELIAFWTRVVNDSKVDLDTRLKASKMLADAVSAFAPCRVELTGAEGGPITVNQSSLAERVALLAAKGKPLPDFLS